MFFIENFCMKAEPTTRHFRPLNIFHKNECKFTVLFFAHIQLTCEKKLKTFDCLVNF